MSKTIRKQTKTDTTAKRSAPKPGANQPKPPRINSKQSQLIAMLKRPDGATIAEVVETLAWQPHTVRGAIAGALKKKLGFEVESEKVDPARGRVYRIAE
jgi:hypothetical protein